MTEMPFYDLLGVLDLVRNKFWNCRGMLGRKNGLDRHSLAALDSIQNTARTKASRL